jgi:hypothetical protein
MRELVTGNSLWVLMLLLSPLVGYSFIQAVTLYAKAKAARRSRSRSLRASSRRLTASWSRRWAGSIWRSRCCFRFRNPADCV